MNSLRPYLPLCAVGLLIWSASAQAVTITAARTDTVNHSDATSALFATKIDGTASAPENGWTPSGFVLAPTSTATTAQAGQITSLTSKKSYGIVGTSTSAGNWIDGNGVPTGITLAFDAEFSISVGANAAVGSVLTLGTTIGNGLGIAQTLGGTGNINAANEPLDFSAFAISNVNFTGTLTEAGFTFTPGGVSGLGVRVIRSNNLNETTTGMTLNVEGTAVLGFGQATGTEGSNLFADNNFGGGGSTSSTFNRKSGPFTLLWAGNAGGSGWSIKGFGVGYDVTYDITGGGPTPLVGDYNSNTAVDAADYSVWRDNLDTAFALPNRNPANTGNVSAADYDAWKNNFSAAPPAAVVGGSVVPEPRALVLLLMGFLLPAMRRGLCG